MDVADRPADCQRHPCRTAGVDAVHEKRGSPDRLVTHKASGRPALLVPSARWTDAAGV